MTKTPAGAKPILLAFSGGLDTSFCVPWLAETYGRPIVTLTVNTGGIDAEAATVLEQRSKALGAVEHYLVDARPAYFEQVIKYLIMGNVRRGNLYPLCVGAERVLQAQTAQWAADRHRCRRSWSPAATSGAFRSRVGTPR
jgi:argininosuccinate synthase